MARTTTVLRSIGQRQLTRVKEEDGTCHYWMYQPGVAQNRVTRDEACALMRMSKADFSRCLDVFLGEEVAA